MKKCSFNSNFRGYARTLSPMDKERGFVNSVYRSFLNLLGKDNCIPIGSYPRFTAIRPLHDLDILYVLGRWDEANHNPQALLEILLRKIKDQYTNPTSSKLEVSLQTHSVTVVFEHNGSEIFSVDIVPAYVHNVNEFSQDMYKVPEVTSVSPRNRKHYYAELSVEGGDMQWVSTDPRGYTEIAKQANQINSDFRKTVKVIKAWKNSCKENDEKFPLKSFHIEQVITRFFQEKNRLEIFDGIFNFFADLPETIRFPKIQDRVGNGKYIDEYLNDLTSGQKDRIIQARDAFLIKLENAEEDGFVQTLIEAYSYAKDSEEKFLFDFNIPMLTDQSNFRIDGRIQKKPGFRDGWLSEVSHKIAKGRKINFQITNDIDKDYTMWKVQNDKNSDEVLANKCTRGEITKYKTLCQPEETAYSGKHYVECFAIKNGICIARSKAKVNIADHYG